MDVNCQSLLCSLFYEQTCSRFTRLVGWLVVTVPRIPLCDVLDYTNHTFSESSRSKDRYSQVSHTKIHKRKYINIQVHKYSIWRSARKTQHVVYFWKENCSRISKMIFACVKRANTKNTNTKYTYTQIQHTKKCQKKVQKSHLSP